MRQMKNSLTQPVKGARDFYPEDLAVRNGLFSCWRKVAKNFGYEEIDGPIIEPFDLFAVKSGDELVNKQMYSFVDKGGEMVGIRPELTPTYSRMVAKKQNQLVFPLRWMMFGEVWRYEKPQAGRSRNFWQWELNLVGGEENLADAEVLAIAAKSMEILGLTPEDVVIRLNDRRFLEESLGKIGIKNETYEQTVKTIDKKERLPEEEYLKCLKGIGLSNEQVNGLENFLNERDCSQSEKLVGLFDLAKQYGISDFLKYDPSIVRGITYYTGTVFECFDRNLELRSIFGGGRFDDLVETFGGGKVPAVGFAVGDLVITELLKKLNRLTNLKVSPTLVLVTIFSRGFLENSLNISQSLRAKNVAAELYPNPEARLDKQLKYADAKDIPFAVIVGPEEARKGLIILKNLKEKRQKTLTFDEVILALDG